MKSHAAGWTIVLNAFMKISSLKTNVSFCYTLRFSNEQTVLFDAFHAAGWTIVLNAFMKISSLKTNVSFCYTLRFSNEQTVLFEVNKMSVVNLKIFFSLGFSM